MEKAPQVYLGKHGILGRHPYRTWSLTGATSDIASDFKNRWENIKNKKSCHFKEGNFFDR
jgi:hypothetical protein